MANPERVMTGEPPRKWIDHYLWPIVSRPFGLRLMYAMTVSSILAALGIAFASGTSTVLCVIMGSLNILLGLFSGMISSSRLRWSSWRSWVIDKPSVDLALMDKFERLARQKRAARISRATRARHRAEGK